MGLLLYTLKSLSLVILKPFFLSVLIILAIIFYWKNRKVSEMQKKISGERINSPLELTLSQFALGIIAGIILGIISSFLGIAFKENSGIEVLFIISILFMLIKPRLACYSYGGAILGFMSLIYTHIFAKGMRTGVFDIDIVALMTLIGILHIVEGILVMVDGSKGSIPVFSKRKGMIYGGYALNRYWFLPINIMIFIQSNTIASAITRNIKTPNWWPIIRGPETLNLIAMCTLVIMTFYGVFNYSGVTFTKSKKEKRKEAGIIIFLYGIIISIIAQFARFGVVSEIIVIILVPVLHEYMISFQAKLEKKRKPIFYSFPGRVCVIEVVPNSVGYKAGIRAGDLIKNINGLMVKSEKEIYRMKDSVISEVNLTIIKNHQEIDVTIEKSENRGLGILVVPVSVLNKNNFNQILKEKQEILRKEEMKKR